MRPGAALRGLAAAAVLALGCYQGAARLPYVWTQRLTAACTFEVRPWVSALSPLLILGGDLSVGLRFAAGIPDFTEERAQRQRTCAARRGGYGARPLVHIIAAWPG